MIRTSTIMCWSGINSLCMCSLFFSFQKSSDIDIFLSFHKRRIYVDTRLHHMLDLTMNIPFFQRGDFPGVVQNGSEAIVLPNPWLSGTKAAPFDQCGFLNFLPFGSLSSAYEFWCFLFFPFLLSSILSHPESGCWWHEWMVP